MKIAIGSDHRGLDLKEAIKNYFNKKSFPDLACATCVTWDDVGTNDVARVDYPEFAQKVCQSVTSQTSDRGILICGSGIGMSIAANRFKGIYAALCWSPDVARVAREHDRANVLVLPSDFLSHDIACKTVEAWLSAKFLAGRYQDRLDLLEKIAKQ